MSKNVEYDSAGYPHKVSEPVASPQVTEIHELINTKSGLIGVRAAQPAAGTTLAQQNAEIAEKYGIDLNNLPPLTEGTTPQAERRVHKESCCLDLDHKGECKRWMKLPPNSAYPNFKEIHIQDDWCPKAGCAPASPCDITAAHGAAHPPVEARAVAPVETPERCLDLWHEEKGCNAALLKCPTCGLSTV